MHCNLLQHDNTFNKVSLNDLSHVDLASGQLHETDASANDKIVIPSILCQLLTITVCVRLILWKVMCDLNFKLGMIKFSIRIFS